MGRISQVFSTLTGCRITILLVFKVNPDGLQPFRDKHHFVVTMTPNMSFQETPDPSVPLLSKVCYFFVGELLRRFRNRARGGREEEEERLDRVQRCRSLSRLLIYSVYNSKGNDKCPTECTGAKISINWRPLICHGGKPINSYTGDGHFICI